MKVNIDNRNSKTKRRKVICWIYRVLPFILIILLSVGTFRIVLAIMLRSKLDAIRAAGYPATLAELNEYYPAVPDDENAAILYEEAFSSYHSVYDNIFNRANSKYRCNFKFAGKVGISGLLLGESLPESRKIANSKFMAVNRETIAVLKQAVKRSKCNFPVKFNKNYMLDISLTPDLNDAVQLLAIEAIMAAQDKNISLATENILTMLKICHALDNRATGFSCYIRYDMQSMTVSTIEYLLSLSEIDNNVLRQIQSALESSLAKDNNIINRALACERIINMNLENFSGYWMDFSPGHQRDVILGYKISRYFGIDTLNQLKILETYDKLLKLDKNDIKAVKSYDAYFEQQLGKLSILYFLATESLQFTDFLLYERLRANTQIKGAIIGIAIERYRLKYHRLPKSLSELAPEFIQPVPNDPFTNRPFRYVVGDIEIPIDKRYRKKYSDSYEKDKKLHYLNGGIIHFIKRSGWMVYSLGKDGQDNNGIPKNMLDSAFCDIPFRCVRKDK